MALVVLHWHPQVSLWKQCKGKRKESAPQSCLLMCPGVPWKELCVHTLINKRLKHLFYCQISN